MSWHVLVATVDDLTELAIAQLRDGQGEEKHRYSLDVQTDAVRGDRAWLTRSYRSKGIFGGGSSEWIPLDPAFARDLLARWPVSPKTGGRAPQTVRALLRVLAGEKAVDAAEAEAKARTQRLGCAESAARRAWPDEDLVAAWLWAKREELGGRSAREAAVESKEGLAQVMALLAPHVDAAEPWVPSVRQAVTEFVTTFVGSRTAAPLGLPAPRTALVDAAVDRLTAIARPVVAIGLGRARQYAPGMIHGYLGETYELHRACWHLDERFGWPVPRKHTNDADGREIDGFTQRLRDIVAAEVLTETLAV